MPDGYLSVEHGQVSLGGQIIPGVLTSMSIGDAVRFDEVEVDSLSGTKKIPMGWEDSAITIEIILPSDDGGTCYDKLADLNGIFKGLDSKSNPKVFAISNAHAIARGVDQVVFKKLRSTETNADDVISVSLSFDEHNPPIIQPEIQTSSTSSNASAAPADTEAEALVDANLTADESSPFSSGFQDGVS